MVPVGRTGDPVKVKVGGALYGAYEGMKRLHPWGRMTPAQARKKYSNLMYYEEL